MGLNKHEPHQLLEARDVISGCPYVNDIQHDTSEEDGDGDCDSLREHSCFRNDSTARDRDKG